MNPIIKAEIARKKRYIHGLVSGKKVRQIALENDVHVSSVYYFMGKIGFTAKTFKRIGNNPHKGFFRGNHG